MKNLSSVKGFFGVVAVMFVQIILFAGLVHASTWAKTYGGSNHDWTNSIQQTSDDGYISAGVTQSFGSGGWDGLVIKLDSNGGMQ